MLRRPSAGWPTSVGRLVEGLESRAFASVSAKARSSFGSTRRSGIRKGPLGIRDRRSLGARPSRASPGLDRRRPPFCISEFASGATLESLDPADVEPLVGDVHATWAAIANADVQGSLTAAPRNEH